MLYDYHENNIKKMIGYYNQVENKIICLYQTSNNLKYFAFDYKRKIFTFDYHSSDYNGYRYISSYEKIEYGSAYMNIEMKVIAIVQLIREKKIRVSLLGCSSSISQ